MLRPAWLSRLLAKTGFRYLLVGGKLFFIDVALFFVLSVMLEMNVALSQAISRSTSMLVGFFSHKFFSFRAVGPGQALSIGSQGAGYTAIAVFNLIISPYLVDFAVDAFDGRRMVGKLVVDVLLFVQTSLILRYIFRFQKGKE